MGEPFHLGTCGTCESKRRASSGAELTGYPLVDACMRELSITGYASNHARLNAASFLAYSMSFDWRCSAVQRRKMVVPFTIACNRYARQYLQSNMMPKYIEQQLSITGHSCAMFCLCSWVAVPMITNQEIGIWMPSKLMTAPQSGSNVSRLGLRSLVAEVH